MADSAQVFEDARLDLAGFLRELPEEKLHTPVPATPGWTIRDIAAHLVGDASSVIAGDYPKEFFQAFGDADAVVALNRWTAEHVRSRAHLSLEEVLEEWDEASVALAAMMRGDAPWPGQMPPFADRVLITDLGVHQHDIYGALGVERERESALIRIAIAGYVAMIGFRIAGTDLRPLRVISGDSVRSTGEEDPGATVRASRFEMFRALSGRRSPEQIAAYEWEGDPQPYIPYFYPYGIRREALKE